MALATDIPQNSDRAGMGHLHTESLGQTAAGVSEKGDVRSVDILVLSPSLHDGSIIHAEHQHLIDPGLLQSNLTLQKAWDLTRRSCWRERTRKTTDDGPLASKAGSHINFHRWEPKVKRNCGELVPNRDTSAECSVGFPLRVQRN